MTRIRTVWIAMLAVVVVSAVAAAPASALPKWFIERREFTGAETVSYRIKSGTKFKIGFTTANVKVRIECTGFQSTGAEIKETRKASTKNFELTVCTVAEPSACAVKSPIPTTALNAELEDVGTEEVFIKFVPAAGATAEFLSFKLANCALAGAFPVKGTARAIEIEPANETVWNLFDFKDTTGSNLSIVTTPVTFLGEAEPSLKGSNVGKVWAGKF